MGTKRRLASKVSEIVQDLPQGPLLDAFSGMCAVGEAIAPWRQVWTNDVQLFPAIVGRALFCTRSEPSPPDRIKDILEPEFRRNMKALERRFSSYLCKEEKYLSTEKLEDIEAGNTLLPFVGNDIRLNQERKRLAKQPSTFPYRLATITYIGSFFGARQCMEIDSLRYAIDAAAQSGFIDSEQKDWLLITLGLVLSRVNNSTGQFAQYLKPREANIDRILEKRRRSVWKEFIVALETISPVGDQLWRSSNRSFCSDALVLLGRMQKDQLRPAVIYADPPYSTVQYSRYYHVLDVIAEYHYPQIQGDGRYPTNRFQTSFAHATAVVEAVTQFIEKASKLGCALVFSYPENGLFINRGGKVVEVMKHHYRCVKIAHRETQKHSTFGGPKASPKVQVVEEIYVGCC